ncbi:hypothetical protein CsSME_00051646 [Camellia sinensis var. sinensis]
MSNLSMLLQWSPYSTEAELLQQVSLYFVVIYLFILVYHKELHSTGNFDNRLLSKTIFFYTICPKQEPLYT